MLLCVFYEETVTFLFLILLVEVRSKQAEQEGGEHMWMADDWKLLRKRSSNSKTYASVEEEEEEEYRKQQPRLNELRKPKKHNKKQFYKKVKEKC